MPGVLVIHENRGLNPYIEDVARRLATANFIAFAPDGLTSVGGYPGDNEKGGQLFEQVDKPKMTEDFIAAARWLKSNARDAPEKSAWSGFALAAVWRTIWRSVWARPLGRVFRSMEARLPLRKCRRSKRRCCCITHRSIRASTGGWPAYEEALKANQIPYTGYMYEGANHGFHNDTTPRYDEAAAKLAWQRTLDFLTNI